MPNSTIATRLHVAAEQEVARAPPRRPSSRRSRTACRVDAVHTDQSNIASTAGNPGGQYESGEPSKSRQPWPCAASARGREIRHRVRRHARPVTCRHEREHERQQRCRRGDEKPANRAAGSGTESISHELLQCRRPLLPTRIHAEMLDAVLAGRRVRAARGDRRRRSACASASARRRHRRREPAHPVVPATTISGIASIGVATAGSPIRPASISTAGMLSPPRLASTTTSAAAYASTARVTVLVNTTRPARDPSGLRFERAARRAVARDQQLRVVELRDRADRRGRRPSRARARRRRRRSAASDRGRTHAAAPRVAARSTGWSSSARTAFGITRIRSGRTPKSDSSVAADPFHSATTRAGASQPGAHACPAEPGRRPEPRVTDLAVHERDTRRRDRAREERGGAVRDHDVDRACLAPQRPHGGPSEPRRAQHREVEHRHRAPLERDRAHRVTEPESARPRGRPRTPGRRAGRCR